MQKRLLVLLLVCLTVACKQHHEQSPIGVSERTQFVNTAGILSAEEAYNQRASNVRVEGKGEVVKLLPDDVNGSKHQRFLVKTANGKTLLFAHNLDLATRVEPLIVGDTLEFKGEYVYNPKGGIVHWTHRDPQGRHEAGWIKHNGQTYQ